MGLFTKTLNDDDNLRKSIKKSTERMSKLEAEIEEREAYDNEYITLWCGEAGERAKLGREHTWENHDKQMITSSMPPVIIEACKEKGIYKVTNLENIKE